MSPGRLSLSGVRLARSLNDDAAERFEKWDKAIRFDPDSAITHFKRAVAHLRKTGSEEDACADLSRAIELDPDFAQAYFNRSILYQRRGESSQALSDLDAAIGHGLRRSAVFNNRAVIHAVSGDSQAEPALADLNHAIKLGPPRAEIYNNRGVVHVSRGELKKAVADLNEAIRIYPEFVIAHANRAITLARLGELDAALADVQTMVDLVAHPSGAIEITQLSERSSTATVGIE